ncbi:two-component system chemotaxis sensor kinase CheA [Azospirillum fermentarium]|uniref:hybrid sensor histidine kinase/response regulator n=1 Tax=Azospirillum fermentarium TaxID=1233114 RepID=UPI00222649B1|nr:response regulator [Azospirillum fermentarium]MCW2246659.1 two-component system chemotaxis sensor kinase CheA [Azospirillum fermentarium]
MTDIRQRLLAAFELEHKEHLAAIRDALRLAEGEGGARLDLQEIHRRAHSLKGAARAVDLPDVEALAHRLESLFLMVQRGERALGPDLFSLIRHTLDAIEDAVAWASRGGTEAGSIAIDTVLAQLDRVVGTGASQPPPPAAVRHAPPPRPVRPADTAAALAAAPVPRLVRINAASLEQLLDTASALLPEVEEQAALNDGLRTLSRDMGVLEQAWRRLRQALPDTPDARLAETLSAFERRLRTAASSTQAVRRRQDRALWNLRRWGGGLHDGVRRLRMVPAESQFGGLGRMVRDLARSQGKEVEADILGLDVEADRMVLQRLKDPVLHLLRNAVSHGIEPPEERLNAGKRAAGSIRLETAVVNGRLRVVIEDDGRGIDLARIAREAAARGLIPDQGEGEAAPLPPEQLTGLLAEPGFSTAAAVTEISGRGMGVTIARQEVLHLQGQLTIAPRPRGGTVVTVEVPVSLSSQRLLFVSVGGHTLALPAADVARVMRVRTTDLLPLGGSPVLRLEDEDVAVVPLAALLSLPLPAPADWAVLAVTRIGGRRVALAVDEAQATRDAVVSGIDEVGLDPQRFLGTVLLENGAPALVLNAGSLALPAHGLPSLPVSTPSAMVRRSHILVVDDSITTRTLEKSILEAHGYRVTLCVDGREALETLHGQTVDLIVSDVEMPRMDGFALVQAVKSDPVLSDIPVILVTSRASDEDRQRGLLLGADAYIVKTRFDQDELLDGIRRLI